MNVEIAHIFCAILGSMTVGDLSVPNSETAPRLAASPGFTRGHPAGTLISRGCKAARAEQQRLLELESWGHVPSAATVPLRWELV